MHAVTWSCVVMRKTHTRTHWNFMIKRTDVSKKKKQQQQKDEQNQREWKDRRNISKLNQT